MACLNFKAVRTLGYAIPVRTVLYPWSTCRQIKCEALETVLQYLEEQPEVSESTMVLLNGLMMKATAIVVTFTISR